MRAERLAGEEEFVVPLRVGHDDLEKEAVALGFRQRVGALALDGVLRGENREIGRERVGVAVDGDGAFLHGLEQRALGLGGRAVDLVGEQEGREDGPLTSVKALRWRSKTFVPVMSAGIRSGVNWMRLKSVPSTWARVRTRSVLATPGTPSMSACWLVKIGDERLIDHVLLADDDFAHFGAGSGQQALELVEILHGGKG